MFTCVGVKGKKGGNGVEQGTKMGQLTLSIEASKGRGSQLRTKSHHSKYEGYLLYSTFINAILAIIFCRCYHTVS
jgi:hypothetical protein